MSTTLSNGYKLPENGDLGSSWFPDLEFDIQRLNDHSHNGIDSNKLTASSISLITETIALDAYTYDEISNRYKAVIAMPSGLRVDTTNINFRDAVTKEKVYLSIEKASINTFNVYSMYPLLSEVVYG